MKKMYMQSFRILRLLLPSAIGAAYALAPHTAHAQTYYSFFSNPTDKYSVTAPSGGSCNAPAIQNAASFADADVNNYTSFGGNISSPLTCDNINYTFKTYLKLSPDSSKISGNMLSGFRIKISAHTDLTVLAQNISIQTFLNNTQAESFSGKDIYFIDLGADSTRLIVYANTTKPFNQLQLTVNANGIPLNKDFEFDVQYAIASNTNLLPVTITNYKAMTTGNNVTISWQSLEEVNISGYRIEKSSNNGTSYTAVTTLPAKGGSDAINYSYTDQLVANGNYLYRVVAIDKDGSSKATDAVLVTIAGKTYLVLMPSIVKAGQNVIVNSGIAGNYQLAVYDLQGRIIKQQQVNAGDKTTISTGNLSAGTYVVKITTASGNTLQAKFIVN